MLSGSRIGSVHWCVRKKKKALPSVFRITFFSLQLFYYYYYFFFLRGDFTDGSDQKLALLNFTHTHVYMCVRLYMCHFDRPAVGGVGVCIDFPLPELPLLVFVEAVPQKHSRAVKEKRAASAFTMGFDNTLGIQWRSIMFLSSCAV